MLLDLTPLPAFLLASVVVILTPGVDVFLLLRTSLRSGTRAGLRALAGIHSASIVQVTLAVTGLGTLITEHPAVLSTLKWVGAGYLLYLASTILRGLWLARSQAVGDSLAAAATPRRPYLRGLFSNLTNPKMLLFSLAFLPQFLGGSAHPAAQLAALGAVFLVLAAVWEVTIVLAAGRIAGKLRNRRVAHSLDLVSAVAFLTISVGLLAG